MFVYFFFYFLPMSHLSEYWIREKQTFLVSDPTSKSEEPRITELDTCIYISLNFQSHFVFVNLYNTFNRYGKATKCF